MMRPLLYKICLFALLMPILVNAHGGKPKGKYTKEKTIKKEFDVNRDALLKVTNSYGNLNLSSWDQDRVLIEVHIKTNGNNEEKVQQKLDEITVRFENSPSIVSAKTTFGSKRSSWGWNWGRNNVNMQVNYTIKLPVKNSVHLNNDYGNITLDRIDGHAKINCDYGRLDIGELRGRNNQLNFDYTSKSSIGYINSGDIVADYSGFTIEKAGNLVIRADYTNSTVHQMENLRYDNDYGSLEIGEAHDITGVSDYVTMKFGKIRGNLDVNADYGSIKIAEMDRDAGNIKIVSDYTGVKIGYDPEYHFNFEITTRYASVKGKDPFELNVSMEKTGSNYYKGYHGNNGSGNHIFIDSEYGGISFYINQ